MFLTHTANNKENFEPLFRETMKIAANNNVILLGDMNSPHKEWNYNFDSAKGKNLIDTMEALNLHTINDTSFPTRTGNSRSIDTCPDLTIVPIIDGLTTWLNTKENLGSDHDIIEVKTFSDNYRRRPRKQKMTHWDAFRKKLGALGSIKEIEEWCCDIKGAYNQATKEYGQESEYLCVDSYLISLWDKKQKLFKRWKKKRHNKKLKLRIRNLEKRTREYASKLANQNWNDFCESLKGTLNSSKTWAIIKGMLNPETTRRETSHQLNKVAHNFKGTDDDLILALKERFELDRNIPPVRRNYQGSPNDFLDREISKEELQQAILTSNKKSAAGADEITNSMLRNLNDAQMEALAKYINDLWLADRLPLQWKHSTITTIPKPGKPLEIKNLRFISLTSCVGKIYERIITTRLQKYIEEHQLFPDCMIGFRQGLSTQDAFLQLKHDIIDNDDDQDQIILALDLKGAFDNVSHDAILKAAEEIQCGERTYNYIRNFLSDRTATIGIGNTRSDPFKAPNRGTPQGSIISPLLFNLTMIKIAKKLEEREEIGKVIYADDITIWTKSGTLQSKLDLLQDIINVLQEPITTNGLKCAPEKSELIRLRSTANNIMPGSVILDGQNIPFRPTIRILGMIIEENNKATSTLSKLGKTVQQLARVVRRITRARKGMRGGHPPPCSSPHNEPHCI